MEIPDIPIHSEIKAVLAKQGIKELRPSQEKAISAGLLQGRNLLICTPTASGKTLIGELAALQGILTGKGKAIYIVPLVALANEKYKEFKKRYSHLCKVALTVGDLDGADPELGEYDLIVCTAEKLDSLLRHRAYWTKSVTTLIVDEVHLLNDVERGPTLEIVLTLLRQMLPAVQIIALSATIGNPGELANWLQAELVIDTWRPVELKKGVYYDNKIDFY